MLGMQVLFAGMPGTPSIFGRSPARPDALSRLQVGSLKLLTLRCSRGKDGKLTFERTGTVGADSAPPQQATENNESSGRFQDPWRSATSRPYSPSAGDTQYSAFRSRRSENDVTRQRYPDTGYVPSVECGSMNSMLPFVFAVGEQLLLVNEWSAATNVAMLIVCGVRTPG